MTTPVGAAITAIAIALLVAAPFALRKIIGKRRDDDGDPDNWRW
jgi:hypothetical protein